MRVLGERRLIMSKTQASSSDTILRNLDELLPDLEALYKDVHSHPELSMQETRTAGLAADRVRAAEGSQRVWESPDRRVDLTVGVQLHHSRQAHVRAREGPGDAHGRGGARKSTAKIKRPASKLKRAAARAKVERIRG